MYFMIHVFIYSLCSLVLSFFMYVVRDLFRSLFIDLSRYVWLAFFIYVVRSFFISFII